MVRTLLSGTCGLAVVLILVASAFSQTQALGVADEPTSVPFEGGQLTITRQKQYGEKLLAFDGKELARNYVVDIDKIVDLGNVKVALVNVFDGGNLCSPAKVIVWKPKGGMIRSTTVDQNRCGAPEAAISDGVIYFVPYLLPGASSALLRWSPVEGLVTLGNVTYTPEPGTGWKDIDSSKIDMIEIFRNEGVYREAESLLGKKITEIATHMIVSDGIKKTGSGVFFASGCAPHNCGVDTFMAVDPTNQKLFFAQMSGEPKPDAWPAVETWPVDVAEAMDRALGWAN